MSILILRNFYPGFTSSCTSDHYHFVCCNYLWVLEGIYGIVDAFHGVGLDVGSHRELTSVSLDDKFSISRAQLAVTVAVNNIYPI